ncbi:hypothetical protein MASR2M29_05150 [Spirochaetota bacterium]
MKVYSLFGLLFIAFFASSCATKVNLKINTDASAELSMSMDMPAPLEAKIRQFSGSPDLTPQASLINAETISGSLTGMSARVLESRLVDLRSYKGTFYVADLKQFLGREKGLSSILLYEKGAGYSSFDFSLDRSNARTLLKLFPGLDEDLLESLQLPAFYDNPVSANEYRTMLGGLLGKTAASSIDDQYFRLELNVPGPIIEVSGQIDAKTGSRSAVLSVKAIDIMVLEKPLRFFIKWKE